jgi:hypothetical protein
MFIERAFLERESLSDRDLSRLQAGLVDAVERYQFAIRNYPADRMERNGRPFLVKLQEKVAVVDELIRLRSEVR